MRRESRSLVTILMFRIVSLPGRTEARLADCTSIYADRHIAQAHRVRKVRDETEHDVSPSAALGPSSKGAVAERRKRMQVRRCGSQPSGTGPADYFTGTVRIDPQYQAKSLSKKETP